MVIDAHTEVSRKVGQESYKGGFANRGFTLQQHWEPANAYNTNKVFKILANSFCDNVLLGKECLNSFIAFLKCTALKFFLIKKLF